MQIHHHHHCFSRHLSHISVAKFTILYLYIYHSLSTDISTKPEFASRLTTYNMDDDDPLIDWNDKGNVTDWFSFDFSLEELRSLRVKQVTREAILHKE